MRQNGALNPVAHSSVSKHKPSSPYQQPNNEKQIEATVMMRIPARAIIPGDHVLIKCIRSTGVVDNVRPSRYDPQKLSITFRDSERVFGTRVSITADREAPVNVTKMAGTPTTSRQRRQGTRTC